MKKMLRTRVIAVMICTGLTLSAAVSGSEQESDLEAVYDSIEAVGDESGEIYQEEMPPEDDGYESAFIDAAADETGSVEEGAEILFSSDCAVEEAEEAEEEDAEDEEEPEEETDLPEGEELSDEDLMTGASADGTASCGAFLTWSIEGGILNINGQGEMDDYTEENPAPWLADPAFEFASVEIGDEVTGIGDRAFFGCSGIISVTIGKSVASIGKAAFSGCTGLTSVEIPNSVLTIGEEAFSGCESLGSVTMSASVLVIPARCFYNCKSLSSMKSSEDPPKPDPAPSGGTDPDPSGKTDPVPSGKTDSDTPEKQDPKKDVTPAPKAKQAQNITVKVKKPSVKASRLKKKKVKIARKKVFTIRNAKGAVSFKKISGNKNLSISKSGVITVKKGTKKGTKKMKVKITAAETEDFSKWEKTVTVKVKVKG